MLFRSVGVNEERLEVAGETWGAAAASVDLAVGVGMGVGVETRDVDVAGNKGAVVEMEEDARTGCESPWLIASSRLMSISGRL